MAFSIVHEIPWSLAALKKVNAQMCINAEVACLDQVPVWFITGTGPTAMFSYDIASSIIGADSEVLSSGLSSGCIFSVETSFLAAHPAPPEVL